MGLGQNCLCCLFLSQISQIYSYINHNISSTPCHPFPGIPPLCTPPPYNMGLGQNCFGCVSFWSQISQIYSHINHNISSTPSLFTPPLCTPPLANMGLGFNWLYFACRRWCYTEAAGPAGPHDSRWSGDLRNNFRGAASHSWDHWPLAASSGSHRIWLHCRGTSSWIRYVSTYISPMQLCFARAIELIAHPKNHPNSFIFMGISAKKCIIKLDIRFHRHHVSLCSFA